ncbi:MAG TPA: mechanosensitive ion channel domain-containing protein [Stellaceae bacterium]|nr:mechanosensitive ion channel domain-containing protein [Stellaceae bacterium]
MAWLALPAMPGRAGETPAAPPPGAAAPTMDNAMRSAGLLQQVLVRLEDEASSDIGMLPETPGTVLHEWRSFDHNRSSLGALVNLGWVTLAGCLALAAERLVARGFSRHRRRLMQTRRGGPTVTGLFLLLLCDILGLAVFAGVFVYSRHWLSRVGVTMALIIFAANVLVRWRVAAVIINVMLRPGNAPARLIELPDEEAHRLARFLSATILAVIVLVGFGRYGLKDVDSGAPHVVALIVAAAVCALYALIVLRARAAAEALIRGAGGGLVGALRAAIARAWLAIGLIAVAGLFLFFVFGLSLGLLSYYHAVVSTLGVWLVLLVLERLAEKGWRHHEDEPAGDDRPEAMERLVARAAQHILAAAVLIGAATILTSIWIKAIHLPAATASRAMYSGVTAFAILFVAYLVWELLRLAIDRHLQDVSRGPRLPGGDHDGEAAPGSRLQTILPILRIAFGAVIAVIAALTVLSHLGVDTAPLIAGAGVFGLAISFGAQSLVRDIISGLFYIWDDAFRVGEYIDTGRLKGTVEALGIRSIKLRHHNGPLHTIPYGQLGAVTNQSRDFATIKFNLRLEPRSDLELVRRTAKRIGLDMQAQPEIAAEVMLPLKMQGIAEVADTAVVVRFKFTARPVKPSWVQREYLKRMYQVFAEKGIVFASGTLMLQTVAPSPEGPARGAALVPLAGGRAEEPAAMMRPAAAQTQPA